MPETDSKKLKKSFSSSVDVPSPQISSRANRSVSERDRPNAGSSNPSEMNAEQRKYWEYRNIYNIPVPQGIELWEDEDKKRWELMNIGGLNESEANRRIKNEKLRNARARRQVSIQYPPPVEQRSRKFFIVSLICFGLQILVGVICVGFAVYQAIVKYQVQAFVAFFILALLPLAGAGGGMLAALNRSRPLGLGTVIFNITSAVGIIVSLINMYSFNSCNYRILEAWVQLAGIIALIQTASFGVVMIIYLDMASTPVINYHQSVSTPENARNYRLPQRSVGSRVREKLEREINLKAGEITRKYKDYLQRKKGSAETPSVRMRRLEEDLEMQEYEQSRNRAEENLPSTSKSGSVDTLRQRSKTADANDDFMKYIA